MDRYYITTPIYYVNAKPHIGHTYTTIACDAAARLARLSGREVIFMTGTDEHGEKIEKASLERFKEPGHEKEFVDEIVPVFKDLWKTLDITYDRFVRTTDPGHRKCVQSCLDKLHKSGDIYQKVYNGWFCTPCETFWSESQSADGKCPDCGRPVERLDETNYFFKMSKHQSWLIDYIKANPDFIRPDFRKNEVLGFLQEPLLDLCISRPKSRLKWGIELPFDTEYVAYVWFDALLNYLSGLGYPGDAETAAAFWPQAIHVIGKDILRHHAVYWPIMLHALGLDMPRSIVAHGWWVLKGEKMSKSKGNVVDPLSVIRKIGVDAYRYFLLREVPFGLDGSFSEEGVVTRYNSDLANDIGNLLNRTLTMVEKYFGGSVAMPAAGSSGPGAEVRALVLALADKVEGSVLKLDFTQALSAIWEVVNRANKLIETAKPWALAKDGKTEELKDLLYTLLEALRIIAILVGPVMPRTSEKMLHQLGCGGGASISLSLARTWGVLKEGVPVSKAEPLFPRIET